MAGGNDTDGLVLRSPKRESIGQMAAHLSPNHGRPSIENQLDQEANVVNGESLAGLLGRGGQNVAIMNQSPNANA